MNSVRLSVDGECPSQGSMKAFPFRRKNSKKLGVNQTHQDAKGIHKFRANVKDVCKNFHDDFYVDDADQAYSIVVTFYIKKPKTVKRKFPTRRNDKDLDKRIRALLDALTLSDVYNPFGLYKDDGQVIKIVASKKYVDSKNVQPKTNVTITKIRYIEDVSVETDDFNEEEKP